MAIDKNTGFSRPIIQYEKCLNCDLCQQVCPQISEDTAITEEYIFGRSASDSKIGTVRDAFISFSADKDIRSNSSSGGMVTALAKYLLSRGLVTHIVLTRMKKTNPLQGEVFISDNAKDIVKAANSKYCPIPVNEISREINELPDTAKICYIGLPCQILGLRKAERISPKLHDKIKFVIGLICGRNFSQLATSCFLRSIGKDEKDIKEIFYRSGEYPGFFQVVLKDNDIIKVPYRNRKAMGGIFSSAFFTPVSCEICVDHFARFADITCGDAWLQEYKKERIGKSAVIARSEFAYKLLYTMAKEEVIHIEKIKVQKIIDSQRKLNRFLLNRSRLKVMKGMFNAKLKNDVSVKKISISHYIRAYVIASFYWVLDVLNFRKLVKYLSWRVVSFFRLIRQI